MRQWLMVDEIIEMALVMISQHPLFKEPIVLSPKTNKPIKITKLRTKDGFDLNETGLTLSIFPYSYVGSSNETTTTSNAALVFEPFTVGSGKFEGFDRCKLCLVVKLQTTGIEDDISSANSTSGMPVVERSLRERYLYRWLTILRTILLTKPIADLGGLVRNSGVNWGSFRTTDWTGQKGQNYVLHAAALLWQLEINMPRNWEMISERSVWDDSSNPSWVYVGVRTIDEVLIYWDTQNNYLVSSLGFPLLNTPKGERVVWNVELKRFETLAGIALTEVQLQDPRLNPVGPWIQTNLEFVATTYPLSKNVYFNKETGKLQLFDRTLIEETADGTPIVWDPEVQTIVFQDSGETVTFNPGTSGPSSTETITLESPIKSPVDPDYYLPGTVVEGISPTTGDAPIVTPETSQQSFPNSSDGIFLPGSGSVSTNLDPNPAPGPDPDPNPNLSTPTGIPILIPGSSEPIYLIPRVNKSIFSIYEANRLELRDTFEL
jgi:hypothetical protein